MTLSASFDANGMSYRITAAEAGDFQGLMDFYGDVIESIAGTESDPRWELGVHPSENDLKSAIEAGMLWVCWARPVDADAGSRDQGGEASAKVDSPSEDTAWHLASAMIVNNDQADGYQNAVWRIDAAADEVAVVHLFATHPRYRKQGLGLRMLGFAEEVACELGARTIRLDVISGNEGVCRAYEKAGFDFRGMHRLNYDDVYDVDFYLYDLVL